MKIEKTQREKLPPISEQMQAWSAALAAEFNAGRKLLRNPSSASRPCIGARLCSAFCPALAASSVEIPWHSDSTG